jgi:hypothetical protein
MIYNNLLVLLLNIKLLFFYDNDKYLHDNFNLIFKNIENINSNTFSSNYKINADKNSINQYKIINIIDDYYLAKNIVNNFDKNNNIKELLKLLLPHVNVNGNNINIEECVIVDLLKSDVQSFPSIHTDIEWGIFDNSNGFQVWYLYENNENIGNMFILDTEYVIPSSYLYYYSDNTIIMREQCGDKIIKKFNNFNDINAKVKYLDMHKGECLIFGKNLYHFSDFRKSKYRYSINFRIIIKDSDGSIPINLTNNCSYNKLFLARLIKNNIKIIKYIQKCLIY